VARQEPIGSHQDRFVKLRDGGHGLSPSASGQGSVKPSFSNLDPTDLGHEFLDWLSVV